MLKIGILGKFGPEEMGKHISDTLKEMRYEVFEFEFGPYLNQNRNNSKYFSKIIKIKNKIFNLGIYSNRKIRENLLKNLINSIKIKELDILISTYDYLSYIEIEKLKINNSKLKIIMWFPDALSNIGRSLFMTAGYDALFFKCHHIVSYLKNYYDLPAFYIGEAYNPKTNFPIKLETSICEVSTVGNLHSYRLPIFEKLAKKKYDLKLYGTEPAFYIPMSKELERYFTGKYITNKERAKIFTNSKINLNTLHMGEVRGVNVRLFEIAGACGFQLASYRDEIKEFFEIGKEIDTFSSFEELVEKIDFYLKNDELREKIAKAGYERAKNNYTYRNRLEEILKIVESL